MVLVTEKTVGQLAAENPAAARILERHQIDYCCGGTRSLDEACRARGLDPQAVLAEIEGAAPPPGEQDWTTALLSDLADHIVAKHHAYLRSELPALSTRIEKVLAAHGERHGDSLRVVRDRFAALSAELGSHMLKEELILFPLIRQMEQARRSGTPLGAAHCGSVNNPIRVMMHEHDSAAGALRDIRSATSGFTLPPDGCTTYAAMLEGLKALEADLHLHIHLENNILFPRASRLEQELAA